MEPTSKAAENIRISVGTFPSAQVSPKQGNQPIKQLTLQIGKTVKNPSAVNLVQIAAPFQSSAQSSSVSQLLGIIPQKMTISNPNVSKTNPQIIAIPAARLASGPLLLPHVQQSLPALTSSALSLQSTPLNISAKRGSQILSGDLQQNALEHLLNYSALQPGGLVRPLSTLVVPPYVNLRTPVAAAAPTIIHSSSGIVCTISSVPNLKTTGDFIQKGSINPSVIRPHCSIVFTTNTSSTTTVAVTTVAASSNITVVTNVMNPNLSPRPTILRRKITSNSPVELITTKSPKPNDVYSLKVTRQLFGELSGQHQIRPSHLARQTEFVQQIRQPDYEGICASSRGPVLYGPLTDMIEADSSNDSSSTISASSDQQCQSEVYHLKRAAKVDMRNSPRKRPRKQQLSSHPTAVVKMDESCMPSLKCEEIFEDIVDSNSKAIVPDDRFILHKYLTQTARQFAGRESPNDSVWSGTDNSDVKGENTDRKDLERLFCHNDAIKSITIANSATDITNGSSHSPLYRARPSLLQSYPHSGSASKGLHNHFLRYEDVRPKDEKHVSVNELANQKQINQRIKGWKAYLILSQFEEMDMFEKANMEVLNNILKTFEDKDSSKSSNGKTLNSLTEEALIAELIRTNLQRCKAIREQITEAKEQFLTLLEHQTSIEVLLQRYVSKRPYRKKDKS